MIDNIHNVFIIPAALDDIPKLVEIELECIPEPWSELSFISEMEKESSIILKASIKDGTICGFLTADVIMDEVNIYNVAVSEKFRRKGIARLLLKNLEKRCMDFAENYFLEVRESNSPAIMLYESMGFERIGIRKNFYRNPTENAILMKKAVKI